MIRQRGVCDCVGAEIERAGFTMRDDMDRADIGAARQMRGDLVEAARLPVDQNDLGLRIDIRHDLGDVGDVLIDEDDGRTSVRGRHGWQRSGRRRKIGTMQIGNHWCDSGLGRNVGRLRGCRDRGRFTVNARGLDVRRIGDRWCARCGLCSRRISILVRIGCSRCGGRSCRRCTVKGHARLKCPVGNR